MGLSLFQATGRTQRERTEMIISALPYSHSCRRSGRSPALPYPPHERLYSITFTAGPLFNVNMGPLSILIFCYNYPRWVQF